MIPLVLGAGCGSADDLSCEVDRAPTLEVEVATLLVARLPQPGGSYSWHYRVLPDLDLDGSEGMRLDWTMEGPLPWADSEEQAAKAEYGWAEDLGMLVSPGHGAGWLATEDGPTRIPGVGGWPDDGMNSAVYLLGQDPGTGAYTADLFMEIPKGSAFDTDTLQGSFLANDLDGDGQDEVLVALSFEPLGGEPLEMIVLDGWSGLPWVPEDGFRLGPSVPPGMEGATDINGDGYTDMLDGALEPRCGGYDLLSLLYVCGPPAQTILHDFDGDGQADLLGIDDRSEMPGWTGSGNREIEVQFGPILTYGAELAPDLTVRDEAHAYNFGAHVAAGDVDGNGAADLFVAYDSGSEGYSGLGYAKGGLDGRDGVLLYLNPGQGGCQELYREDAYADLWIDDADAVFGHWLWLFDNNGDGVLDLFTFGAEDPYPLEGPYPDWIAYVVDFSAILPGAEAP